MLGGPEHPSIVQNDLVHFAHPLVGVEENDTVEDIDWLCKKIIDLRIFADKEGKNKKRKGHWPIGVMSCDLILMKNHE